MFDRRLWSRNFVLINLCVALASFTNFSYIYILPVHVLRIGGTNTDVGLMGAGLTAFGLLTRLVMSPLIDRWGRKPMLMLGIGLYAANSLGYWILRDSVACMIIMRCVSGFSQGILFPVPPTCVSDVSPRDRLVDALGIFGISSALPAIFRHDAVPGRRRRDWRGSVRPDGGARRISAYFPHCGRCRRNSDSGFPERPLRGVTETSGLSGNFRKARQFPVSRPGSGEKSYSLYKFDTYQGKARRFAGGACAPFAGFSCLVENHVKIGEPEFPVNTFFTVSSLFGHAPCSDKNLRR